MSRLDDILALPSVTHTLVQGSPEWDQFRLQRRGASEAAAALGLSKKVPRNELLRAKHTGLAREFSDWLRKNVLDKGHEVEAMARPHVERMIGDDLYPVTRSRGNLSASCDGLTMDDRIAFEHKQWNDDLAAMVAAGIVPDEHLPQCHQVLLVTGAEALIFVVSDGTPDRMVAATVNPDRGWWERIVAAWDQFDADLAEYEPPEVVAPTVAAPVEALPAVSVRMDGALAVVSNLDVFGAALRAYVAKIPAKPSTDQEFADADAACKALKRAEDALDGAEANALGQVQSVETLTRTIADLRTVARTARLATEKLVTARKTQIRTEEVQRGKDALAAHIATLNQSLGRPYMPPVAVDFGAAISGKKTLDSLRNAIDTELARCKIVANEWAGRIQINLNWLREHAKDHAALFPDTGAIVLKAHDDLVALAENRIAAHTAAEEQRLEAERERIRAEESERLEREAAQRALKEAAAAEAARIAAAPAPTQPPAADPIAPPAVSSQAANVVPMGTRAPDTGARLRLGEINARLAPIALTADGLAALGFQPVATDKAAKLYAAADFPRICAALVAHVSKVSGQQRAA